MHGHRGGGAMTVLSPLGRVPRRRPPTRRRSRRPIPAVVLLLALSVLAVAVWWRVLHRGAGEATAGACPARPSASVLTFDTRRVKVRVYNATTRSGLARRVAGQLRQRGFNIAATSNDPLAETRQVQGVGELRYGPLGARQAQLVSWHFPGIRLAEDPRTDAVVDVAIGPAFRALGNASQVSQAKKRAAAAAAAKQNPRC
jgi:hypothetical protein